MTFFIRIKEQKKLEPDERMARSDEEDAEQRRREKGSLHCIIVIKWVKGSKVICYAPHLILIYPSSLHCANLHFNVFVAVFKISCFDFDIYFLCVAFAKIFFKQRKSFNTACDRADSLYVEVACDHPANNLGVEEV